jgi:MutS domain V
MATEQHTDPSTDQHFGESRGPDAVYTGRLAESRTVLLAEQQRDRRFGYAKLTVLALLFFGAIALVRTPARLAWLLIPLAVFVVLAILHEKVLQRVRNGNRVLTFYERGLARLQEQWAGTGEGGERFLDPAHPYARDLDLFGKGSLFELLCSARTRAGEETLAQWLLEPATLEVILARQAAVADLRERVPFRERLFATSDSVRASVHPKWLAEWGEAKPDLGPQGLRRVMAVLAAVWAVSAIYWMATSVWYPLLVMTVLNLAVNRWLGSGVVSFVRATEFAAVDLKVLADVLAVLEAEKFEAPLLQSLQFGLRTQGMAPSAAIRRLDRMAHYLESRRNLIFRVFNRPLFYVAQVAFAAEAWRRHHGASIRGWLAVVGEIEALAALSAYAYEHPTAVFPDFVEEGPYFEAEAFAHPLLPEAQAVRNDLRLDRSLRLVLISGPNMAGKSTFVRAVGINAVLAQCGGTVQAHRLRMSRLALGASICVLDSLQGGVSRFYAEIQRLKLISDMTKKPVPVMFLLDELLSGTNSHDRLTGTQFLVRALVAHGAVGLITTHDLALTQIPETITGVAVNCHFEDHLESGKLVFDYKLRPGVVRTSNALKLMQSIGLVGAEDESGG